MKKTILLVGLIAVFGFGAFLSSCKKDEKTTPKLPTCTCTATVDGKPESTTVDLSNTDALKEDWGEDFVEDVKSGKVKTCGDLEELLNDVEDFTYIFGDSEEDYEISCKVK
ncbi:MAG: hypothetical protein LBO71_00275 [Prevotellaceae bacterium]|jgi:hypothetical protein|nr:hypothetical protein [Prevotellaceae bacterium]